MFQKELNLLNSIQQECFTYNSPLGLSKGNRTETIKQETSDLLVVRNLCWETDPNFDPLDVLTEQSTMVEGVDSMEQEDPLNTLLHKDLDVEPHLIDDGDIEIKEEALEPSSLDHWL